MFLFFTVCFVVVWVIAKVSQGLGVRAAATTGISSWFHVVLVAVVYPLTLVPVSLLFGSEAVEVSGSWIWKFLFVASAIGAVFQTIVLVKGGVQKLVTLATGLILSWLAVGLAV